MVELVLTSLADQIGWTDSDVFECPAPTGLFLVSAPNDIAPNSMVEVDDGYLCWLAPGRCLAVTATPPAGFVSDVTQGSALFVVRVHAAELLAMGSALPASALGEGRCAQTLFAGVKTLLYRRAGLLHIHVDRPLAPYLRDWLRQAATSF